MLVLGRRVGQSIMIGREIEVVILGTDGGQVRVGIRAPRDVSVMRRELLQQVQEENRLAAVGSIGSVLGQLRTQDLSVSPPSDGGDRPAVGRAAG